MAKKKEWKGRQLLPQLQLQLPFPFAVKASLGTETDRRTNRSTADSFVCARVDHSSKVQNKPLTNGAGQPRQPGRPTTAPAQVASSNNNSNIDFGFGLAAAAATGAAFKAVFGLAS